MTEFDADEPWWPADEETAARLGAGLTPVAPPPELRAQLLAAIEHAPAETVAAVLPAPGRPVAPGGRQGTRPAWGRGIVYIAAACLLVLAGVGLGRWSVQGPMGQVSDFASLNQAQDVRRINDRLPDGHLATLTWSPRMEMAAVTMPSHMDVPKESCYQIWVKKEGQFTAGGRYAPVSNGGFSFIDAMPTPGTEIWITVEPLTGSPRPSSRPVVVWQIEEDPEIGQSPDTRKGTV
ncbi:anti-sigma factor [Buchananella hordeovulneris]|uniref:anti-sigma factor n=1 Tax=Buchananella hordeovulneris TaxID=52770 RepID=UPI000F5D507F|nr:anti-sigma factor [Buchananella hordeovulneris]RRD44610.1 anti-sigma factor [Buchananella hordeovulneris]